VAFSADKTFGVTRDDLILAALRKLSVYDSASGASAYEITDAAFSLNAIMKEWSAEGLSVWLRQRTIVFLNQGQPYYWLGPNPTNDSTNIIWHQACADSQYKASSISADEAAGQTIISITDGTWLDFNGQSATKPTTGNIGIRLDSGAMHWTTIAAVGANTVTLTAAIPTAAATDQPVYTFVNRTSRPIRVLDAFRRSTDDIDTPVMLIGRNDYEGLSNKLSEGDPLQVMFEAAIQEQTSNALHSRINVWPVENSTSCDILVLITEHYPDDLDATSNNPQFPIEWANALIWNLAAELAPEYGVSPRERMALERTAAIKKGTLFSLDVDNASVSFAPDAMGR